MQTRERSAGAASAPTGANPTRGAQVARGLHPRAPLDSKRTRGLTVDFYVTLTFVRFEGNYDSLERS